jgi:hypothetical protein
MKYYGDYYTKDFNYLSHDRLKANGVRKDVKMSAMTVWFREVIAGLKQFFYGGTLHGVK